MEVALLRSSFFFLSGMFGGHIAFYSLFVLHMLSYMCFDFEHALDFGFESQDIVQFTHQK
jgi:hypothetical protein